VIATPLHRLIAAEHLLDSSAQRFGAIDDEQVFALRRKALIAKAGEQTFDTGGVLCRSRLDSQNVFLAFCVHAHRAEDVMISFTGASPGPWCAPAG
jgi:hypothetical protein